MKIIKGCLYAVAIYFTLCSAAFVVGLVLDKIYPVSNDQQEIEQIHKMLVGPQKQEVKHVKAPDFI